MTSFDAGQGNPATTSEVERVAALPGEPHHVSAAGVTRTASRLSTLENPGAFESAPQLRLVIVADDERAGRAALDAVRWFKTSSPRALRDRWTVSALLLAYANDATPVQKLQFPPEKGFFDHPEQPESRYAWRWATYQAPDVVLELRGGDVLSRGSAPAGSLAAAMAGGSEIGTAPAVFAMVRETDGPTLLQQILKESAAARPSELHATLAARVSREPAAIARVLAQRYPQNPIVSYIPSVAWANTLRLADITKDDSLRQKVLLETRPWLSGERPLFGERIALTAAAGTLIYADLAARGEEAARSLAVQGAEAAARMAPNGYAQHGQGWTDDMFMAAAILARSGRMPGRGGDLDHLAAFLISYGGRLQREDGIFVHFTDGRVPWGRGNGFAALGQTEALTSLPANHPSRARLLDMYRRHMNGMRAMQAPDGMWRQVVDEPGAYREESVTAMTLTSMARGVRLGWLDETYRPVIDRAWRALAAHITEDGGVVDVCTGTGSGPDRRFYLDRTAINGFDDRGGAMALLAATEMMLLRAKP
jgi:rhamnogalacturonyl hydrolase YesR